VQEYDSNKVACTQWNSPHLQLIDLTKPVKERVPEQILDYDNNNDHATDLCPLPGYDPHSLPFMIKRGQSRVTLVDLVNRTNYTMYKEENNKWGYCKVAISAKDGDGRFKLFFVVNEGETDQVLKRYDFPNVYEEGLRKIVNLRHKHEDVTLWQRLFKGKK
jgi:hypothetical protein